MNIMLLEATSPLYFLISYHKQYGTNMATINCGGGTALAFLMWR